MKVVSVRIVATPEEPWELSLRIPGWCTTASVAVAGEAAVTVASGQRSVGLARSWRVGDSIVLDLDMPPRVTTPHPRVDAVRGAVALERGPLVYALESADLPDGVDLEDVSLLPRGDLTPIARMDLGPSIVALAMAVSTPTGTAEVQAIPYLAWGNRGDGGMRVWIPVDPTS